jgi:hypothetical protein
LRNEGNNHRTNPDEYARRNVAHKGCFALDYYYGGGDDVHFVFSSLQLQHVNIRRQQQAQTAVQKCHQAVLIGVVQVPRPGGGFALIWDALHPHVERIYVHTELN